MPEHIYRHGSTGKAPARHLNRLYIIAERSQHEHTASTVPVKTWIPAAAEYQHSTSTEQEYGHSQHSTRTAPAKGQGVSIASTAPGQNSTMLGKIQHSTRKKPEVVASQYSTSAKLADINSQHSGREEPRKPRFQHITSTVPGNNKNSTNHSTMPGLRQ